MLSIFLVGIALSMDAFSVALSIGLNNVTVLKKTMLILLISLMHFFMPALGLLLGNEVLKIFNINIKIVASLVFLYLAYIIFKEKDVETSSKMTSFLSLIMISFSVSIDSFSVGLCLPGLTTHYFLSFFIFSICSGTITYIGFIIAKYSIKLLKKRSALFASILLSLLAIVNMCQIFWH